MRNFRVRFVDQWGDVIVYDEWRGPVPREGELVDVEKKRDDGLYRIDGQVSEVRYRIQQRGEIDSVEIMVQPSMRTGEDEGEEEGS